MSKNKHENELAAMFGENSDQITQYAKIGLVVAALLAIGGIVWGINASTQEKKLADAWAAYKDALEAQNEDPNGNALTEMATKGEFAGTTPAWWALKAAADTKLTQGINKMMQYDREAGQKDLENAIQAYDEVVKSGGNDPLLKQPSLIGLAKAHETLAELDDAKKYYQRVIDVRKGNSFAKHAQERLDYLEKEGVAEWYKWFAKHEYRPPAPPMQPGINLPAAPDISLPSTSSPTTDTPGGGVSFEGLGASLEESTDPKKPNGDASPGPNSSVPNDEPANDAASKQDDMPTGDTPNDTDTKPAVEPPVNEPKKDDAPATTKDSDAKPATHDKADGDAPPEPDAPEPSGNSADEPGDEKTPADSDGETKEGSDASDGS